MSDGELRQIFRKHLPQFDWQAIETGSTSGGVPDLNYADQTGVEGWIECKQCSHWRIKVRPMQIGWCERRLRFNPRVFVAVRRDRDELWFYHASKLRDLSEARLDAVEPSGTWAGGPARWQWHRIAGWLRTG